MLLMDRVNYLDSRGAAKEEHVPVPHHLTKIFKRKQKRKCSVQSGFLLQYRMLANKSRRHYMM